MKTNHAARVIQTRWKKHRGDPDKKKEEEQRFNVGRKFELCLLGLFTAFWGKSDHWESKNFGWFSMLAFAEKKRIFCYCAVPIVMRFSLEKLVQFGCELIIILLNCILKNSICLDLFTCICKGLAFQTYACYHMFCIFRILKSGSLCELLLC